MVISYRSASKPIKAKELVIFLRGEKGISIEIRIFWRYIDRRAAWPRRNIQISMGIRILWQYMGCRTACPRHNIQATVQILGNLIDKGSEAVGKLGQISLNRRVASANRQTSRRCMFRNSA